MPKIDIAKSGKVEGSGYPTPFHECAAGRVKERLGDAGGLSDFGVNLTHLPPGAWSSQRHWHAGEDEFVWVISGALTLILLDTRGSSSGVVRRSPMVVAKKRPFAWG